VHDVSLLDIVGDLARRLVVRNEGVMDVLDVDLFRQACALLEVLTRECPKNAVALYNGDSGLLSSLDEVINVLASSDPEVLREGRIGVPYVDIPHDERAIELLLREPEALYWPSPLTESCIGLLVALATHAKPPPHAKPKPESEEEEEEELTMDKIYSDSLRLTLNRIISRQPPTDEPTDTLVSQSLQLLKLFTQNGDTVLLMHTHLTNDLLFNTYLPKAKCVATVRDVLQLVRDRYASHRDWEDFLRGRGANDFRGKTGPDPVTHLTFRDRLGPALPFLEAVVREEEGGGWDGLREALRDVL
jgi:hypothetical protein